MFDFNEVYLTQCILFFFFFFFFLLKVVTLLLRRVNKKERSQNMSRVRKPFIVEKKNPVWFFLPPITQLLCNVLCDY